LNKNELKYSNIQTAFTFGKKIDKNEVGQPDYKKQFQPFMDALKTSGIMKKKKKHGQIHNLSKVLTNSTAATHIVDGELVLMKHDI